MNSKEALEILFSSYNFDGNYHDLIIAREKLEQSLDRLEQLEKALNILISKKVDVNHLKNTKDFNEYNRIRHFYEADYLTQEQYILLKEVLEDGR